LVYKDEKVNPNTDKHKWANCLKN